MIDCGSRKHHCRARAGNAGRSSTTPSRAAFNSAISERRRAVSFDDSVLSIATSRRNWPISSCELAMFRANFSTEHSGKRFKPPFQIIARQQIIARALRLAANLCAWCSWRLRIFRHRAFRFFRLPGVNMPPISRAL